jgi:carboxyl-terminal processing protease
MLAVLICLSLASALACNRTPASAVGDPNAAQRAAESGQPRQPAASGPRPTPSPTLLTGSDIGLAYQFILESFVEPVDHQRLIESASFALRQSVTEAGALPADSAPLDFLPPLTGNADRDLAPLATAFDAVVQRHPAWALQVRPDYLAIQNMLEGLNDSHSTFVPAEEARRRAETSYSGIGIRIARPDPAGPPVVVEVFQGSPAAAAGVRGGDRIVAIDDRQVSQLDLSEVASLIRGPQGSEVALLLERTAAGGPVNVRAARRPIDTPQADGQILEQRVGYIRIRNFGETVAERVGRLVLEQQQAGAEGWIIDLRGNPGGSLTAVSRVAGYFMESRPIGISVDRAGQREAIVAERRPFRVQAPLVLLIDGDSGSASEVLASAFSEYRLAGLVGQRSAGSVGIASVRPLSDGSNLQVTVRRLLSPSGATLDKVGVEPDVQVALTAQDLEGGRDPQRDQALRLLRERMVRR